MKKNIRGQLIMLSKRLLYGFTLQLLFCSVLLANTSNAQRKNIEKIKVGISVKNTPLEKVFKNIEQQTGLAFTYNTGNVDINQKVDVDVKNKTVYALLMDLSIDTGLKFIQINDNIHVKARQFETLESVIIEETAGIEVIGKVVDETGLGIPGVTILVEGTTKGTVSDIDGNFSIAAEQGSVLVFSFIGFTQQKITVGNQAEINVTMLEDEQALDEVVVVGYGEQKKVNTTGAISTVKYDDELNNRPITNASQALGGTASGVWVSQNSGKPGDDGAQIRVRGWGTLNNSNPLIIIDGVEGSFDQINPADIESMSVLKDAASAAIYGSKAANGVVLVTTKMGNNEEKMQVSLNSYYGIQSLGRRYELIDNSAVHMDLSNKALINDGSSPLFSNALINAFRDGTDKYRYPSTDWFSELFQTAPIQQHNLSITGGSKNVSSYLSLNYLDQNGMVANTKSSRYALRANLESKVNKWLNVSGRLNYLTRKSEEPYADITYGSLGRVFEMLGGAAPYIAPYTSDGRYGSVQAIAENGSLLYDNRNPLIDAANGKTLTEDHVITINTSADVKFTDYLSWKTTFASNINFNLVDRYNTSVFGYTDTGIETITKNFNREGLEINRTSLIGIHNNLFSTLNFNKKVGEHHQFTAIAGMQLESNKIRNVFARRSQPPKEGLTQVDAGTSGIQSNGNLNSFKMLSYFGRINYSLSDKYLFEANVRADGSSRFKSGNRWGVFPGFSAGWRIIDESFMENQKVFSNLKLRASWGKLGNQNISSFWPYLTVIDQNNGLSYNYGGAFAAGAGVTALVDEDITWETTATLDIGLELGFMDDQITIEADYFKKKTENIIVQLPVPSLLGGLNPPFENLGEMSNDGFEFIFNYNNFKFRRDQLAFNMGLNFTYIKNEVTKFAAGKSPDQLYLIREGYAFRTLYGFNAVGIYKSDDEALEHMYANGFKPKAGNLKFEDINGDGRLTFEDKKSLGNTIPKVTFGMSPSFKYKGFDLNLLFQGVLGVSVYTQNNFTNLTFENRVISTTWLDAWTPDNTNTTVPSARFDNSWDQSESSYWVQKLNYIKLKNIQLGYALDDNLISRVGLQKAYVYINAQNVFTLVTDDYEGFDPERNTFDSGYNYYPVPRIVSLGVNLNF
ncbi:SusC/RagA family TonB-linked outer membrane protein [Algoriphagus resistens]|uniref:SusC/RagA family TonB-linked outer membrane protein n=1 Tax=Algoriphagus resistens TaxID=1750590 RepID=UPI000716C24A|nr:TonB-dependent receptor [Algoriphagus resistens]